MPRPDTTTHSEQLGALANAWGHFKQAEPGPSPPHWRKFLSEFGTTALDLPARCGGYEWTTSDMILIAEACGSYDLDWRDVPGIGHAFFLAFSRGRHYDWLLRKAAEAEAFVAIAITEEDAGSDLRSLVTTAKPTADGYVISGRKKYVSRVHEATHVIVFAQVPRGENKLTAFLLPKETRGLEWNLITPMGLRGVSWSELCLSEIAVSAEYRIGGEGEASSLFIRHFTRWRILMAAAAIGCARAAIDQTIVRLRSRSCFGNPVGRFSHLQQQLAVHLSRIYMCKLLIRETALRIDLKLPAVADSAMCKAEAIESSLDAVQFCMLVHGAQGYETSTGIEKRLRDLLGLRVADGTSDVLRGQVAQAVLGNELYNLSLGRTQKRDWSAIQSRRFW